MDSALESAMDSQSPLDLVNHCESAMVTALMLEYWFQSQLVNGCESAMVIGFVSAMDFGFEFRVEYDWALESVNGCESEMVIGLVVGSRFSSPSAYDSASRLKFHLAMGLECSLASWEYVEPTLLEDLMKFDHSPDQSNRTTMNASQGRDQSMIMRLLS
jgi:hypothetical protein